MREEIFNFEDSIKELLDEVYDNIARTEDILDHFKAREKYYKEKLDALDGIKKNPKLGKTFVQLLRLLNE